MPSIMHSLFYKFALFVGAGCQCASEICDWVVMFHAITARVALRHYRECSAFPPPPKQMAMIWIARFRNVIMQSHTLNFNHVSAIQMRTIFCVCIVSASLHPARPNRHFLFIFATSWLNWWSLLLIFGCNTHFSFAVGSFRCSCSAWYLGRSRIEWFKQHGRRHYQRRWTNSISVHSNWCPTTNGK